MSGEQSPPIREVENLVTTGPVSIERSQINQLTQVDRVDELNFHGQNQIHGGNIENLTIEGSSNEIENSQIQNMTVIENHHTDIGNVENLTISEGQNAGTTEIHNVESLTVNESGSAQINIAENVNLANYSTVHVHHPNVQVQFQGQINFILQQIQQQQIQARCRFDGEALMRWQKETPIHYGDMEGTRHLITPPMFDHTPLVHLTTFQRLNSDMRTLGYRGFTKLSELFQHGLPVKDLIAFIGEPGSGKSVFLKMLQSYFIGLGYYPFVITAKALSPRESLPFAQFVKNYGCPGYYIADTESFGEWLYENRLKILFLFDGLDELSFRMTDTFQPVNTHDSATVDTWVGMLFSLQIMIGCKVIFTSRPSSLYNLPITQRPDEVYNLNGFEGEGLKHAVNIYNEQKASEIVELINNKASQDNSFIRAPFTVALIALTFKRSSEEITTDTTLTQLYTLAFHQRHRSAHNRISENESLDTLKRAEASVDEFYFQRWNADQLHGFTEADIEVVDDLNAQLVENLSFVNVSVKQTSHRIYPEDKLYETPHLSITEYHCARAVLRNMDVAKFYDFVETLFSLETIDKMIMVRRFLSGLIHNPECDTTKRDLFLKKLVDELKASMSGILLDKYEGDKLDQAYLLQGYLFSDIAELSRNETDFVRDQFSLGSGFIMQLRMKNAKSIEGAAKFLGKVDPHLRYLVLFLSEDVQVTHFTRLVDAVAKLSKNIPAVQVLHLQLDSNHVDDLKKLISKVDRGILLRYNTDVDVAQIEMIVHGLQHEMDQRSHLRLFYEIVHRRHWKVLRHSEYTSATSPLILVSHYGGERKTINLKNMDFSSMLEIRKNLHFIFDFVVSEKVEFESLTKIVSEFPQLKIGHIHIYMNSEFTKQIMKQFCHNFANFITKVDWIYLYNVTGNTITCEEVELLLKRTGKLLELYYLEKMSTGEKEELDRKLAHVYEFQTPKLRVDTFTE